MVAKVDPARATPDIPDVPDRPLPNGFRKITEAGKHESGWPLMIAGDRDQVPMVLVPGATFTMGSDRGEAAEAPSHSVRLSTYYIDQHEVTCGQFRNYLEKEPRGKTDAAKWLADEKFRSAPDQAPVVGITYREADTYALWAGKRLPTEAQWEMAARSFESRRYPWGNDPPKWSRPRAPRQISEVKSFPEDESIYGAFDMAGNALEWTRDWYDPRYFEKLVDKVAEDPAGPIKAYRSIVRVVKGGSKSWLLSAREGTEIDRRLPYLGFRCMVAVEGPDAPASIVVRPTTKPAAAQPSQAGQPAANSVPF
jgi:formylglycine-generating enzyme required for sulfatase activity